jgi:Asp-tRNA(Asn)/Glu-tRNA(Gln) amidotransferase A subunit family amidase
MSKPSFDRRRFLALCSGLGLSATVFPSLLWSAMQEQRRVTREMIDHAAALAGVSIADEHKEMMLDGLNRNLGAYEQVRALGIRNDVAPALLFDPVLPGMQVERGHRPLRLSPPPRAEVPKNLEDVAFQSVRSLAHLLESRVLSPTALTEMYLERLKRYDPILHFVITLTEERALAQARQADREIAAGKYRGPLHGIPWGAKDLLAVRGYRTTWGAGGFEEQVIDEDAAVVKKLDEAGAVLVAKLTLGALALGDKWFGGMTRNPWKLEQGSSGSSAGSASAVAAGCVGFAIGSETLGSISSPATRCGATGLRPTFGRVSRAGAMALSWSMDKLGPLCREVEDCALVLSAIHGADPGDRSARDAAFNWDAQLDPRTLRVGVLQKEFEREPETKENDEEKARRLEWQQFNDAALARLREMGVKMTPVELPELPLRALLSTLTAECAAAFDDLTRSGRDRLLTEQGPNDWPNTFRTGRFLPAVEYINANRARTLAMEATARIFRDFDVLVAPTTAPQLILTNLTGHPAVILPHGFRASDGTPVSLTFLGGLYGEAKMLALARAYQQATGWHLKRPSLKVLQEASARVEHDLAGLSEFAV